MYPGTYKKTPDSSGQILFDFGLEVDGAARSPSPSLGYSLISQKSHAGNISGIMGKLFQTGSEGEKEVQDQKGQEEAHKGNEQFIQKEFPVPTEFTRERNPVLFRNLDIATMGG